MPNPPTSTAVYNADNELTNWNGATLTYDGNGNLLNDSANTYGWNARNQLNSISGTTAASFQYGPFGRRLGKTINGNTTNFLYDGVNPVQELVGGSPSANLLTGLGVDEDFQRTDLLGTSDFLSDALSSTLALADPTGTVQTQYTYDPFGGTTTQGAANASSFQFTGRENDDDGLHYYRARYYDPTLARFVSQDALGGDIGMDLYAYAVDGPEIFADPLGLSPTSGRGACGFNHCMVENATNFSLAGAVDAVFYTNLRNKWYVKPFGGNLFTDTYASLAGSESPTGLAGVTPDVVRAGMGTPLTFGRRTSDIISLNLEGKGGLPRALSSSSAGVSSAMETAGRVLNLGMDLGTRLELDAALFTAEMAWCAMTSSGY